MGTLLDALRAGGDRTPYVIYEGATASDDRIEARRRGALGATNRPDELFEMVVAALNLWGLTGRSTARAGTLLLAGELQWTETERVLRQS